MRITKNQNQKPERASYARSETGASEVLHGDLAFKDFNFADCSCYSCINPVAFYV